MINLSGAEGLKVARSPFHEVDAILERIKDDVDSVIVDFHAEMTSEKIAMGWHLGSKVAAVFGTHTHVPTAIHRCAGGTALSLTCRNDRVADQRAGSQARAGDRAVYYSDAGQVRNCWQGSN